RCSSTSRRSSTTRRSISSSAPRPTWARSPKACGPSRRAGNDSRRAIVARAIRLALAALDRDLLTDRQRKEKHVGGEAERQVDRVTDVTQVGPTPSCLADVVRDSAEHDDVRLADPEGVIGAVGLGFRSFPKDMLASDRHAARKHGERQQESEPSQRRALRAKDHSHTCSSAVGSWPGSGKGGGGASPPEKRWPTR